LSLVNGAISDQYQQNRWPFGGTLGEGGGGVEGGVGDEQPLPPPLPLVLLVVPSPTLGGSGKRDAQLVGPCPPVYSLLMRPNQSLLDISGHTPRSGADQI
jgi:hypothetical protein